MTSITTQTTVGQLVAARPARSRVFEQLGIDYCCGGKLPLEQTCDAHGLDAATVVKMLEAVDHAITEAENAGASAAAHVDAAAMSLTDLADHIEKTHHAYLRTELPRLQWMIGKVANAHGQRYPWVVQIQHLFAGFQEELMAHMFKEENILFPIIRALESGQDHKLNHCGGSIANPIRVMEAEHDGAGDALAQFNKLTNNYTAPPDACNTFLAMMDALAQLEKDMHQHVHKENNILFPKALTLEASLIGVG